MSGERVVDGVVVVVYTLQTGYVNAFDVFRLKNKAPSRRIIICHRVIRILNVGLMLSFD